MKKTLLLKNSLFVFVVVLVLSGGSVFGQVAVNQDFETATWTDAATGWTNTAGTGLSIVTSGTNPTQSVHGGTKELKWNSYSAQTSVTLISPVFSEQSRAANTPSITLWWYRDVSAYNTSSFATEGLTVKMNTSASTTGATTLGFIPRNGITSTSGSNITGTATTSSSGWYLYTFTMPSAFNTATNYILFTFVSQAGNNCFMDDISYQTYPLACSGTPAPGNTVATVNPVTNGSSTVLSLQNATTGSGVTYQWQSSSDNSAWGNVASAGTSSTYTATPNAATYYRCNVTCSGNTGASNSLLVNLTYCSPTSSSQATYINNFSITSGVTTFTNNASGATSGGYIDYSATKLCSQYPAYTSNFSFTMASGLSAGVAIWVDWNNDFIFNNTLYNSSSAPTGELMYNSAGYLSPATVTGSILVPTGASIGNHRMRILTDYNATSPAPCSFTTTPQGEAEDYTFTVVALPACTTPSAQPTSLSLTSVTATTLSGSFTAASPAPSGYLVVRSTSATPPTPLNGTTYAAAATTLGAGTYVVTGNTTSSTATTFSETSLSANTQYYYYIFSYNSTCAGAPYYLTTSPLTANTTTCLATPSTPTASTITTSGFTTNWGAVTGATGYSIAVATDSGFAAPISGYPFSVSSNSYALSGLTSGNTYYYRVTATGGSCNSVVSASASSTLVCAAPTSLAASASSTLQTYTTITGAFTAAPTAPTGYLVVRTPTNVQPTPVTGTTYSTGANAIGNIDYVGTAVSSWTSTGLTLGTTYYYWVFSYTNSTCTGGPVYSASTTSFSQATPSCPTFAATIAINGATAVAGTSYPTLTAAIADFKTCGILQPTVLELTSTYVASAETFPILLSVITGASATNTITIREASGVTGKSITTTNTTATIDINGGNYWIIDGRSGGTGSADLAIGNTGGAPAIRFINEGSNNTVKYVTVTSTISSATSGLVVFSTTTGSNGNDNNTIDNCDLNGGGTAGNIIYASGTTTTTATNNSGNVISNNKIRDQFLVGTATNGVLVSTGNTDWTISGNSFYQTATRTYTTGVIHTALYINNTSGNNFSILNNNIGGTAASLGGTALTMTGSSTRYVPIYLSLGTTTASSVQGNTISNINLTSSSGAFTAPGVFCGIYVAAGTVNIGNVTGNTVGSSTGTGAITATSSTTGGLSFGIASDAVSTVNISNNIIGSLTISGSATTVSHSFIAINSAGTAGNYSINSNTIGSTSSANSINLNTISTNVNGQQLAGIVNSATGTITISNNTIANLNNANNTSGTTTFSPVTRGIVSSGGSTTISGNTVRNLSSGSFYTAAASVIGIQCSTTIANAVLSNNTIYGLSNSNLAATTVNGISFACPSTGTNLVSRNLIYGLSTASSTGSATTGTIGLNISGGIATIQNNIVRLGIDLAGSSQTGTNGCIGIYDVTGTNNYYHNSVYIGGSGVTTGVINTYAFNSAVTTNTRNFQNNIFINARANSTTGGKHYAITVAGTATNPAGLTCNYNIYQATGTGGVFGFFNAADVTTIAAWRTATGQDANSKNTDPCLNDPAAAIPNLHLTNCSGTGSPADAAGVNIAGVTDDIDGETRSSLSPNDIGADAGLYGPTGVDMGVTSLIAPIQGGCKTATETVTVRVTNYSTSLIDFSVNPVTVSATCSIGVYSSSTILNSGTLAAGGTQDVVMAATIDMTTNGTYTFNASTSVTGDVNATNDSMTTVSRTVNSLGGTYTVGAAGNYTTLTSAVNAFNTATCITGPIIFSLTDASYTTSENFPITINSNSYSSSTNTLTIKPATGVTASISGSSASAIIKLNGADYVTIDGSTNGGSDKSLTISNTYTTASTGSDIWVASNGASNGATYNTIKNCNISGTGPTTAKTYAGILSSSGTTYSSAAESPNSNNSYTSNAITAVNNGIVFWGHASNDVANIVSNNTIGSATSTSKITYTGIYISNQNSININNNTVSGIYYTTSIPYLTGIYVGGTMIGGSISKNIINDVKNSTANQAYGIMLNSTSTTGNVTLSNNIIYDINCLGTSATLTNGGHGIVIAAGGGYNIYYNTVNLNTSNGGSTSTGISAALYVASGVSGLDIRNNIFSNSQTSTTRYAIYSTAANSVFTTIDNNNYYSAGTSLGYLTSARITLTDIQTGFGGNTNSKNILPNFASATDIHLNVNSNDGLNNLGTPISGITTDIDGTTRDSSTPDMGADEFTPSPAFAISASSAIICNGATSSSITITSGASDYTTFSWSPSSGVSGTSSTGWTFNPTITTTYTLTVTNSGNSNTRTATVLVTVNSAPSAITFTPTSATICNGNVQTIVASGGTMPSQLNQFSLAGSSSIYSAITGTSVSGAIGDDVGVGSLPIGFTFSYNGVDQTVFGVSSNGFIELGSNLTYANNTAAAWTPSTNLLAGRANIIAPLWDDNNTTGGTVIYATTGTAPNRVLTVQWTGMHVAGTGSSSSPTIDMQLKLYESGSINFLYGTQSAALSSPTASVGISGTVGNYISVTALSPITTSTFSTSIENNSVITNNIPSGTILSFSRPTSSISWNNTDSLYLNTGVTTAYAGNPTTVYAKPTVNTTYTATATSSAGCTSSNTLTVNVSPLSVAGTSAGTSTICSGNSVTVSLSGYTGTIQWQQSLNGTSGWANVTGGSGATTDSYATPNLTVTTYYRAVVTSGACTSANSSTITITVNATTVAGTATAVNSNFCSGNGTTVNLTGSTGTIQWQSSSSFNGTYSDISGATSASLATGNLTATSYYQAVVTSGVCSALTTSKETVTVNSLPTTYTVTGGGAYCSGGSGVAVGLDNSAVGVNYQLVRGGSTNVGSAVAGTGAAIAFGNQTTAGTYTVVATNATTTCTSTMTGNAVVAINALPTIALSYIDDVSPLATSFSISYTALTGSPTLYSITAVSPNPMTGFTAFSAATLGTSPISVTIPQSAAAEYSFNLTITNSNGCSNNYPFQFHVTALAHGTIGTDQTICSGATPAALTSIAAATGAGTITYSWEQSTTAINTGYSAISSATSTTYAPGALTQTTYYKRVASNGLETSDSDPITITVNPNPTALVLTGSTNCSGSLGTITSSASVSGVNYQLYNASNVAIGSVVAGTDSGLSWSSIAIATGYYVKATNATTTCVSANSNAVAVGTITDKTWIGTTNNSWNTASNWSCNSVPSTSDTIVISSGNPQLDTDFTVAGSLTISGTGTLTINSTKTLTISAPVNFGGKSVTIKSDANGTGAIGQVSGPLTNATNVTVERYIPAKRSWRALTSPVITSGSIYANWQEGGVGNTVNGFDIWSPNATDASVTTGGVSNSLMEYNSTSNTWSGITNTASTSSSSMLTADGKNKPFMAFPTGPFGTGNITTGQTATTIRATGTLLTGPQNYACLGTKYTLIGNPYASTLSIIDLLISINPAFEGNLWVWDPNGIGTNGVGAYNLFDAAAFGYANTTSGTFSNSTTTAIQSGQAFFVKPTSDQTFTIQEIFKNSDTNNAVFGKQSNTQAEVIRVGIFKQINNVWTGRDGAMEVIFPEASATQTANKMANVTENIAFTKNGNYFASEHHLPLVSTDTLNVRIWKTTAGANYKLKINTEQFTTTGLDATLQDMYTNSNTPISLDGTAVEYPFTVTSDATSSGDRFRIVFSPTLGTHNFTNSSIKISPNPIIGDSFQVSLGSLSSGNYDYFITNSIGQEIGKGSIMHNEQVGSNTVKMRENVAAGIYIVKIIGTDKSVYTTKLIKQ